MKTFELPERWWRRWDNHPGTIRWWAEYYIWKFLRLDYHGNYYKANPEKARKHNQFLGWIRAGKGCDEAMRAERAYLNPSLWEPAEIIERPEMQAERDEIVEHNHEIGFKPTFHEQLGDPALHIPLEYKPIEGEEGWELPT